MMKSSLVQRLRGIYTSGDDEVQITKDFSNFIPPISVEAADRIELLEGLIRDASDYLDYNELTSIGSGSVLHRSFKRVLEDK